MYFTKQLYMFSHQILFYKMSVTDGNVLLRCFVLDHAPLSIETCQLVRQYDYVQKNVLGCIPFCDDSSDMKEFDVRTYIVDHLNA